MRTLTDTAPAAVTRPPGARERVARSERVRVGDRAAAGALTLLVGVSATLRSIIGLHHSVPRYFPDEYIYTALARSLAHGHLEIRGATARFPEILEPLLAAPLWRLFPAQIAYHLVQCENAVLASLAAVPIYLIARWLRLDRSYSLFCAAFGLALPALTFTSFTVSDLLGYPLVLTTLLVGLRSLDEPTRRGQLAFLGLATLSSLTRLQYALVVPAYLVAAFVLERRRTFRNHRIAWLSIAPTAAIVLFGAAGYYFARDTNGLHLRPLAVGHWMVLQAFLLTVEAGVIVVPGAVAAVTRPAGRRERVFSAFGSTFVIFTLAAASDWAVASQRFKARYLFMVLPLLVIAFGLYHRRRRLSPLVLAIAGAVAIALPLLPLTSYTAASFKSDSQYLFGVWFVERHLGVATAALALALLGTLGCVGTALVALGRLPRTAVMTWTFALVAVFAAFSIAEDQQETRAYRATLPRDLSWVDHSTRGAVTAVATTPFPSDNLRQQLYWNTTIRREVVLHGAVPTDAFAAPPLEISSRGAMTNVGDNVLFDDSSATGRLANARRIASSDGFTLWHASATPRLRLLITNRGSDGWLGYGGAIHAWPLDPANAVRVSFVVSLPRGWHPAVLRIGRARILVSPGRGRRVTCRSGRGALDLRYTSSDIVLDQELRHVIARMSGPRIRDVPSVGDRVSANRCSVGD